MLGELLRHGSQSLIGAPSRDGGSDQMLLILAAIVAAVVWWILRATVKPPEWFSFSYAQYAFVAVFLVEALFVFAQQAKSCGSWSWGVYGVLDVLPAYWVLAPWTLALLLVAPLAGGSSYLYVRRYQGFLISLSVLAVITLPLLTAALTIRANFTCQAL